MRELKFLFALWKADWQGAMEYRGAFITQVVMMMLNNAFYFVFWVIFFDRVGSLGGWGLGDMYVLFGVAASAFGLVSFLFGNAFNLSEVITRGRLDYYLSLPRPVLLHALASRSIPIGVGDFLYGILSFMVSGMFSLEGFARFLLGVVLAACVFAGFMIIVNSLAFWLGNSTGLSQLGTNAMVSFALYPVSLFENPTRLILFTLIPAALMGSVPAELVHTWSVRARMPRSTRPPPLAQLSICKCGNAWRRRSMIS